MATINEVRATFDAARAEISALDQALAAERTTIRRAAFHEGRPLTHAEIARRKEIAATRTKLAEALEALALSTIDALENADDLDNLLHSINSVNQQIDDDLARLTGLVDYAETAAKVVEGIAKSVEKLSEFRPNLLG